MTGTEAYANSNLEDKVNAHRVLANVYFSLVHSSFVTFLLLQFFRGLNAVQDMFADPVEQRVSKDQDKAQHFPKYAVKLVYCMITSACALALLC